MPPRERFIALIPLWRSVEPRPAAMSPQPTPEQLAEQKKEAEEHAKAAAQGPSPDHLAGKSVKGSTRSTGAHL
jgi:hypothetical protein